MKNNILNLIVLLNVSIILISCNESSTGSPTGQLFSVSGYVYMKSEPVNDATISIDNKTNYTTTSNSEGYFEIKDVQEGEHALSVLKDANNNGGFSERNYDLVVFNHVILNSLTLPEPVFLYLPIITVQGIELAWSPTDANDFREYKLYRHTSSGLDETTGELIHVSTTRDDTTFINNTLNLEPNTYYYRVYVMNEYGKLGGSNIVDITVSETILRIRIIYNGQYTVSQINKLYVGVSNNPCYNECQDEGVLTNNDSSIDVNVEVLGQGRMSIYGPYYISSFLDITGTHQGAHLLPNGCPFVVYDGIDPLIAKSNCNSSPVYVLNGETKEIIINLSDEFLTDNYTP